MESNEMIENLESQRSVLIDQVNALDKVIAMFKASNGFPLTVNKTDIAGDNLAAKKDTAFAKLNDRQKIAYAIKLENRFLHVREIAKKLNELGPTISIEQWIKKVSPALTALKNSGTVEKVTVGKTNLNTFWGSPNWLTADKEIIKGHEYDENQLQKSPERIEI